MRHRNLPVYLNVATIFLIILITANMSAITQAIIAEPYAYLSAVWAGSEDPVWLHLGLVPLGTLAGIAVGAGILFDRPRFAETTRQFALWFLMVGVPLESLCTILLFVVDERVSTAQQSKIIMLERRLTARSLSDEQIADIRSRLSHFSGQAFEVLPYWENRESLGIANLIATALIGAGWCLDQTTPSPMIVGVETSVHIGVETTATQGTRDAASALVRALNDSDIEAEADREHDNPNPTNKIDITIGIKP